MERFAEAGGNFIDTANHYAGGESERILGELVAPNREHWVIATKYGLNARPGDPNGGGAHRKSLARSLDESLKRLGTDYVDLYWVHIWDAFTPVEEVVCALDEQVRAGKILYVGVSDTPAWNVSRAVTLAEERGMERFNALQVPYSLVERTVERDLLPMARALDLAVTTWAPLGGGLLTGRYGTGRARPEGTRLAGIGGRHEENATSGRNLAIADAVNAVAAERGVSATQVAIAWVLAQRRRRGVVIPIVGARTASHSSATTSGRWTSSCRRTTSRAWRRPAGSSSASPTTSGGPGWPTARPSTSSTTTTAWCTPSCERRQPTTRTASRKGAKR